MSRPTPKTRPVRIVILPGDTRFNLGDIAICLATVRMLRHVYPACTIAVWGKRPFVDGGFEAVRFHDRFGLGAVRAAWAADVVVWGGGQLLQGNRSVVKIPYWLARIAGLRLLGKRIIGFGQGLGPFPRRIDRMLVRAAVACTDVFTVRDRESLRTVLALGAAPGRVRLTADPAVAWVADTSPPGPAPEYAPAEGNGQRGSGPGDGSGRRPQLGISLRYTRHHRQGRIVPFQFLPPAARRRILNSPDMEAFTDTMTRVCDHLVETLGADLVFVPMYYAPWETDVTLALAILGRMRHRDRARIVRPRCDVAELLHVFDSLDAFVGTPMHATILATARHVPTLALHYEPKGREYLALAGLEEWAFPLDDVWGEDGPRRLEERILELWRQRTRIREDLRRRIPGLRRRSLANVRYLHAALRG